MYMICIWIFISAGGLEFDILDKAKITIKNHQNNFSPLPPSFNLII